MPPADSHDPDQHELVRRETDLAAADLHGALTSEDWVTAVHLVSGRWPDLVFGGHQEAVRSLVARIPHRFLNDEPVLGFFAELSGRIAPRSLDLPLPEGRQELHRLGRSQRAGHALRGSAVAIAARRSRGLHQDSLELARRGRVVAEAAEWTADDDVDRLIPFWFLHAGIAAQLAGDFGLARRLHRSAHRLRARTSYGFVGADAAGNLAMVNALDGNLAAADRWIARASEERYDDSWISHLVPTAGAVARTIVATDRLDLSSLRRSLDELLDTVDLDEQWPNVIWARTRAALLVGDPLEMAASIRRGAAVHGHRLGDSGWAHDVVGLCDAEIALSAGRAHQAKAVLERLGPKRPFVLVTRARLALLTGEPEEAHDLIAADLAMTEASPRLRAEALLVMAHGRDLLGDDAGALVALNEVIRIVAQHGSLALFASVPRQLLEKHEACAVGMTEILEALDTAGVGELFPSELKLVDLTPRELVVLEHLATGATIAGIAEQLFVSVNTVKSQTASLYRKFDVGTREGVVAAARTVGLLP